MNNAERWIPLLFLLSCAHAPPIVNTPGAMVIRVPAQMTVTGMRVAMSSGAPPDSIAAHCLAVFGRTLPATGRALRIEWHRHHLDGRLVCGEAARHKLPADPKVRHAGMLFWESSDNILSIGVPGDAGRAPISPKAMKHLGVDGYFYGSNDPSECAKLARTSAVRFLSELSRVAPGFERLLFPGLTAAQAICPCSFQGVRARAPLNPTWRPLDWLQITTESPGRTVGTQWVQCGPTWRWVEVLGPKGWEAIGRYSRDHYIKRLAGGDGIIYDQWLFLRGNPKPFLDVTGYAVNGDGTRVGDLTCIGDDSIHCALLRLLEYDSHGRVARDWKIPVPPGEYLPEGYSLDGSFLVRWVLPDAVSWVLGEVNRNGLTVLEPLPEDGDAWTAVFDRHRSEPVFLEPPPLEEAAPATPLR